ncbi:MAG: hypothetical protein K2F91_08865, partial [Muribaculaceae bacterium]|nr:hypothetical protein [Muribaculaceae bacterium]
FTVALANKTASAFVVELGSAGQGNPFLLWGYDEKGQEDSEFTMALSNLKTQAGEEITVMTAEKCVVSDLLGQAGTVQIQNAQIELPFVLDLSAAGIENVTTENNAPVEYFNLQGVRVANPENGLYIRRQGNKVSKVLVK